VEHSSQATILVRGGDRLDVFVTMHSEQCAYIDDQTPQLLERGLKLGDLLAGPDVGGGEGRKLLDHFLIIERAVIQRIVVIGALQQFQETQKCVKRDRIVRSAALGAP